VAEEYPDCNCNVEANVHVNSEGANECGYLNFFNTGSGGNLLPISPVIYKARQYLESNCAIQSISNYIANNPSTDAQVEFKSGRIIILKDGFKSGGTFWAHIVDCPLLKKGDSSKDAENPIDLINSYRFAPNPNTGHFTLTQTQEGYIKSYQILNLMGQPLLRSKLELGQTEKVIEMGGLAKGIYILQLETTDGMKAERVVYQ
jgi:hypothetical protein